MFLNIYSEIYITLCLTHTSYILVKYGVKSKIIHYFKEFQIYKKGLFQIIKLKQHDTSTGSLFKEKKILKISDFINFKHTKFHRKCLQQENLSFEKSKNLNENI